MRIHAGSVTPSHCCESIALSAQSPLLLVDAARDAWRRRAIAVAPVLAGGLYPWLLQLAYAAVDRHETSDLSEKVARALVAGALMFAAPGAGLWLMSRLSRAGSMTLGELRLRSIATLVLAAPPLFTLIGVEAWLSGIARFENAIWLAIWLPLAAVALGTTAERVTPAPRRPQATSWRIAHGVGALLLLTGFIGLHLANHLGGLAGAETHLRVMHALRHWYRSTVVEPALLGLCLLQVVTGAVLARRWLARAVDAARALQAATGTYLGLYLVCHLNSVFVYARANGTDTDFWFASGGRAGLLGDAWDVRLVPHYALAVLFLFVHLGAGLRVVLLAHGRKTGWLMPAAWSVGAAVSLGAVLPLLRIHAS